MRRLCCWVLPGFFAVLAWAESAAVENARLHPADFQANHLAGEYLLAKKDLPGAIPYLEKAWQLDPANYANGYDLALACLEIGRTQKSRAVVEALLKLRDKAELHNLLGDVEEAEGHVNEAAHQYESAARLDPSEKNIFDLGSDLLKHRGFMPALTTFQFAVGRYAGSARMRVGLGIAYYSLGRYSEAVQTLCEAVDLDPGDTNALDFLGKMVDVSPQYAEDVRKRLERFARIYPENSAANYYYAVSLRKRNLGAGDNDAAERYLLKAARLRHGFSDAHFQLGLLYEDEARDREAIRQYELAVKYQSDFQKAHYHLARLYQKTGEGEAAQREFQLLKGLRKN